MQVRTPLLIVLRGEPDRRRALAATLLVTAALVPTEVAEHGPVLCPLRRWTGLLCPGCGLTRSLSSLLHGDVLGALVFHPGGLLVAAVLLVWAVGRRDAWAPRSWTTTPGRRAALALLGVVWLGGAAARVVQLGPAV